MDVQSTNTLIGVVENLKPAPQGLLDRYFGTVQTEESEEIHFDIHDGKRRVAPFVSPLKEGRIVESLGFRTSTIKPAYIKDKRVFDASRPLRRAFGEQIGGVLSAQERENALLAMEMEDQMNSIRRRLELMASAALRAATATITGEDYPTVAIDFGRAANLKPVALAGAAQWGQAGVKLLKYLSDNAVLPLRATGKGVRDVIMGLDAWGVFCEDAQVEKRLDLMRVAQTAAGQPSLAMGTQSEEGLLYRGSIDGFDIYTYSGWYVDPADGVEKEIWPAKEVCITSPGIQGVQAFGAIRDRKAGYAAVPFFPKMWEVEDPAALLIMLQSAPIVVPTNVNVAFTQQVLA